MITASQLVPAHHTGNQVMRFFLMTELIGADRVKRRIQGYRKRIENPRPFLERCGTILSKSAAKTFNMQGRPRWAARKDTKTHPILDKTGRMRDSVELQQATSDSVYHIMISKAHSVLDFGTRVFYGFFHQLGTKKMVKRPFLHIQDEDRREILQAAANWFFHGKL